MKKAIKFLFICIIISTISSSCKKKGCTNSNAQNYSSEAKEDDGSCTFATTTNTGGSDFTLTSSAISNGELLAAFKCETKTNGVENSIPLSWSNVPSGTGSLAIIMHHFPNPTDTEKANSYLLLWGISPSITEMAYGTADDGPWYMGSDKDGTTVSYSSPCSKSSGTHAYTITVYALSTVPSSLPTQSTVSVDYATLKTAINSVSIVGKAELNFNDVN